MRGILQDCVKIYFIQEKYFTKWNP